ncbi:peptide ABC transporter substrate-binding protein [Lacticaseibacillus hulanensis]|uniref:peptide ABC transporter substrate-binding protein n=1 Tax=Lacticaseibacillus hulanensis TaxID=2493111 RepID=UPI000FDA64E2|nr:peptide ABC transporter substrate-binding protein [Lacticaseibacillus hulanensis]
MQTEVKIGAIIAAGITLTVAGGWYLRNQPQQAQNDTTSNTPLRVSNTTTIESLDSTHYSTLAAASAIGNLFDGLYGHNGKGALIADVSNGSPQVSADKKTYTFTLRHYRWTNGSPVTADDFVYAWQRLADPATESRNASRIDILANGEQVRMGTMPLSALGVRALSKYKLQVKLSTPQPYLAETLSSAPFMPINRAYAKAQGRKYGQDAHHILTNGPFKITNWSGASDTSWNLVKNNVYYFRRNLQLNKVRFTVNADATTAAAKFKANQLDFTAIDAQTVPQYLGNRKLHRVTTTTGAYLYFNTATGPTKNVHLRQAIATSFDKHLFATGKLENGAKELNGIIPAGLATSPSGVDFRKAADSQAQYNTVHALSEWHKAQRALGKNALTLTLNIASNTEAELAATYLKGQIEHNLPGVKIQIKKTSLEQRVALENAGKFEIVFSTWTPPDVDPYNLLSFGQTDSRTNVSGYSDAHYDHLLSEISKLGNEPKRRWQKEIDAEKYLLNKDIPMTGVYQGGLAYLLTDRVESFPVLPNGIVNYEYVRLH